MSIKAHDTNFTYQTKVLQQRVEGMLFKVLCTVKISICVSDDVYFQTKE